MKLNRYMAIILVLTSASMIILYLAPRTHGEESGWWEIRDGEVRNLSGNKSIERILGTNLYVVMENLTGTVRIHDPNVILQGAYGKYIEIRGRLDVWTNANNTLIRNLVFKGDGTMVNGQGCENLTIRNCTFLDDAIISPSGFATRFNIYNNTFVGTAESSRIAIWVWQCGFGGPYYNLTEPSLIHDNDITGYKKGIYIHSSVGTIVYGNRIRNNRQEGLFRLLRCPAAAGTGCRWSCPG